MEQHAGDHVERFKDTIAFGSGSLEGGDLNFAIIEDEIEIFHGRDFGQVAFVVLHDVGNIVEVEVEGLEVLFEVFEGLDVLLHFIVLGVGDKDDTVDAAQNDLAGGVVDDLAGNGKEGEFGFEPLDGDGFEREEVEKEGAIAGGSEGGHLALGGGVGHLHVGVHLLEVGGLAALGRTVVDDLYLKLLGRLVDNGHVCLLWAG